MALNLLQICLRALNHISGFNAPTYIIGNTDDTAKTLLSAAYAVGEELVRDYAWQECAKTATVTTTDGTSLYDLESDYDRIVPDTMWDTDNYEPIIGHTSKRRWAYITNSQVNSTGVDYFFRLKGNQIQIEPAADGEFDFSYEYLSNVYCTASDGSTERADGWVADTDLPKLPQDLFILGIRYYFADSKTLSRATKWGGEYYAAINSRKNKNVPSQMIDRNEGLIIPGTVQSTLNIPDEITGY